MTGADFGSHFLREKNKRTIVPLGPGRPDICQNFGGCRVQKKIGGYRRISAKILSANMWFQNFGAASVESRANPWDVDTWKPANWHLEISTWFWRSFRGNCGKSWWLSKNLPTHV